MSVYVRPFRKSDLSAFEPLEPLMPYERFDSELAQAIEDSDLSVTGVRDGRVIGCGGVHPLGSGQGELWLRLSKSCLKHRLSTLRWLKEGLKIIEEVFPFSQLNAAIRCDFKQGAKLIKFLGFQQTEIKMYEGRRWFIFSKLVKE